MSFLRKHANICHWFLVILTIFIFIASAGQQLTTLAVGSPTFIILWVIKVVVASLSLSVPLAIGARQKPFQNRGWTVACCWLIGALSMMGSRFASKPVAVHMVGVLKSP